MATAKLDTETRREQIADAALALLGSGGLAALSVSAVARRLGLVPSALYRHFRGKDRILDAVLDRIRDRLHDNLERSCAATDDALERLERLLDLHVALIRENRGIPRLVFSEATLGGSPERARRLFGIVESFVGGVAQIVRRGQEVGRVRADRDAETVAMAFLGIVQPAALLWHLSGGKFDVTRHGRRAWSMLRSEIEAVGQPVRPLPDGPRRNR